MIKDSDEIDFDNVEAFERFLNLPKDALKNIPIYARVPAIRAIAKVREMEKNCHFRPGLYYIVLVDLCGHTQFNVKYGDAEGDVRVEWFQTTVIQTLGEIAHRNYCSFIKTIGDGALLIFSSFFDVFEWSQKLTQNLESMSLEYPENLRKRGVYCPVEEIDTRLEDFNMRARRLVHIGEVSFKDGSDTICLSVSQTFKIEKFFSEIELGCTQAVSDAIQPKVQELDVELVENRQIEMPGAPQAAMSYYIKKRQRAVK